MSADPGGFGDAPLERRPFAEAADFPSSARQLAPRMGNPLAGEQVLFVPRR